MAKVAVDQWRKAEMNDKSGTLFCINAGDTCKLASLARTVKPGSLQPAELARCTARINVLLEKARRQADGRCLRFLRTPYGPLLAWASCEPETDAGEPGERIALEDEPEEFCQRLAVVATTTTQNHWVAKPDGKYYCLSGGTTQFAPKLAAVDRLSDAHDARLAQCTSAINALLEQCEARYEGSGLDLCFLTVPPGFLLALTEHRHTDEGLPAGGVTAASPAADIITALSLAHPDRPRSAARIALLVAAALLALGTGAWAASNLGAETVPPVTPRPTTPAAVPSDSPEPSAPAAPSLAPSPSALPGASALTPPAGPASAVSTPSSGSASARPTPLASPTPARTPTRTLPATPAPSATPVATPVPTPVATPSPSATRSAAPGPP